MTTCCKGLAPKVECQCDKDELAGDASAALYRRWRNEQAIAERFRSALTEIAKGEGAYSRDPLTHATNTIDSMKQIALDALGAD